MEVGEDVLCYEVSAYYNSNIGAIYSIIAY